MVGWVSCLRVGVGGVGLVIVAFGGLVLQRLYWGFVTDVVVVLVVFRVVSIWFLVVRGFVTGVAGVLVLFRVLGSSGFGC